LAMAHRLPGRQVAVARELTKLHEECRTGSAEELAEHYTAHPPKGEIVLLAAPPEASVAGDDEIDRLRGEAITRLKPSQAAGEAARASGRDRKTVCARARERLAR